MIAQFIKFCVVGASGLLVDFGITYLLKEKLRINKYIANSTGFICAASTNYLLNRVWTFENHNPEIARQYLLFMAISALGLLINNGVIYLLADRFKMNFYLSKLIAIGVVTFWNFFLNFFITFSF